MKEQANVESKQRRGKPFFLVLGLLLLLILNNLNVDYAVVLLKDEMQIPQWYLILLFGLNIAAMGALVGIYGFRKLGVYLFPITIMFHFIIHLNFLMTFLYTDVFMMFFFIGIGLLVFIPKWELFK
ncbi:hypothetical protein GNY06_02080 [Elizabethkingia argentiflava]|uniref:DoxX family protein n=1 Tax=Elizabethkingia argenteiflava TaxID=2681556 RepID=A0A845PRE0_9FLAO|nr:hypothetical protein [Elizabethkingia argenteiflava]NAW50225.1 hypothetical protein [Elizabethkingia argenteiflava]